MIIMVSRIEGDRIFHIKTEVRPSARPYTGTEKVVTVRQGLIPSERGGATHLDRYKLRESTRSRVDTSGLTRRAQIGRNERV